MSNPAFSDIGACVFDAYGTLFDVHSAVARGGGALGQKAQAVSDLWRQKQLEYTWLRSLMGAHADFWQVTEEALAFALQAHAAEDPALQARLMELYLTLDAYDDVSDCLDRLRAGGKATAILSNGSPRMLEAAVTSAGIAGLLDHCLSIESVGVYKPDGRVYQFAVDQLAVPGERIAFISTNAWDASGAAHFGFRVAWMNRFNKQPDRLPGTFSAIIHSLADLPPLLGL
ncbi:MAG: haloacid dehalogenase type II [Kiloniellales bacterium]|nr:haloacid dehalogenase type II [Kiloniellales bacterium]